MVRADLRRSVLTAAMIAIAAACGGGEEVAGPPSTAEVATTPAPTSTAAVVPTAPSTGATASTTTTPGTTAAGTTTPTPVATAAPATTVAPVGGAFDALTGLWFLECEEYIPGDGATSGVLDIEQTGPEQITVNVQGYRYLSADCSDEPTPDASNVLVFEALGVTDGPGGTDFAVADASIGFTDTLTLGGNGVLTVDGDPWTRSVDFNTAYD